MDFRIRLPFVVARCGVAALIGLAFIASTQSLAVEPSPVASESNSSVGSLATATASITVSPTSQLRKPTVSAAKDVATSAQRETAAAQAHERSSAESKFRFAAMRWLNRSGNRPATDFGIQLENPSGPAVSERPIVVLIHGYNSTPQRMSPLRDTILAAGFECGTFAYPNDEAIADSAELLARELRRLRQSYPNRQIALITHSMGGLVAREVVENPALDPGNVAQLIMIAPPSQGTSCAYIVWSGDVWEHFLHTHDHNLLNDIYASLEDGLGEARDDLKPDSDFLRRLNSRPRNPRVKYSVFAGNGSRFTREQLAALRRLLRKSAEADSLVALMEPALQRALDGFEDSTQPGDGVVSIARARLEGVDDTVVLEFDHWNSVAEPSCEPVAALHREILKRIGSQAEPLTVSAAR